MIKKKIRCYTVLGNVYPGISNYPVYCVVYEGWSNFSFATCIQCGELFVIDWENPKTEGKSITEIASSSCCPTCNSFLRDTLKEYPLTLNIQASDKNSNIATVTFKIEKPSSPQPAAALNSGAIPPITASDQPVFHAVLIACSNYGGGKWPQLPTTISEAKAFKNILNTSYGFDTANILELYDRGYVDILSGLSSKLQSLKDNDNLVIFFAGHGTYRQAGNELIGYWVPLNANAPDIDYISNKKLDELIAGTKVKHILMLSDACYSAAMRGENEIKTPSKYEYQLRSRQVLTGGGLEKVPGESVFVKMVSKALSINTDTYISASSLYNLIYNGVRKEADTEPKLFDFGKDGNEGGQFYFIRKKG